MKINISYLKCEGNWNNGLILVLFDLKSKQQRASLASRGSLVVTMKQWFGPLEQKFGSQKFIWELSFQTIHPALHPLPHNPVRQHLTAVLVSVI